MYAPLCLLDADVARRGAVLRPGPWRRHVHDADPDESAAELARHERLRLVGQVLGEELLGEGDLQRAHSHSAGETHNATASAASIHVQQSPEATKHKRVFINQMR